MSVEIKVPSLGESVVEATVAKWYKNEGDSVSIDEPLLELETDKVNVEVPAPSNGILSNIAVKEGETVNVGSLLGTINGGTSIQPKVKEGDMILFPSSLLHEAPVNRTDTRRTIISYNIRGYVDYVKHTLFSPVGETTINNDKHRT